MGLITGFNHVVLVTNDMDKTVRFYRDALGLRVAATVTRATRPPGTLTRSGDEWNRLYFFDVGNGDTLAFAEFPGKDTTAEKSYFFGAWPGEGRAITRLQKMEHIALNVEGLRQLKAVQKRLRSKGILVSEVQDLKGSPFVKSIYVYDPNWIPLEVATFDRKTPAWRRRKKSDWFNDPSPVPALRPAKASRRVNVAATAVKAKTARA
ncbi:MAG: VOC family protein [Chloroflexi bacterium]|nr:VOC family protein [Chloroflexota bacterium]